MVKLNLGPAAAGGFIAPCFDRDAIQAHVDMLHERAAGVPGLLVVSAFHVTPDIATADAPGTVTHHKVGERDGMVDAIMAHEGTPNVNVYTGLQVYRPGLARGSRGRESDVVAVLGVVADMDADTGKTGAVPCEPSYIVETSPGNQQPVWLFDSPVTAADAKPLAQSLKAATGADHGTADVTHIWRIPGTLNWPNIKKLSRGRAREPAVVSFAAPWQGMDFKPSELAARLPAPARAVAGAAVDIGQLPNVTDIELSDLAQSLLAADGQPDRSAHAARVIEQLAYEGHDADTCAALVLGCSGAWRERYADDDRLRQDVARLWGKYGRAHHDDAQFGAASAAALIRPFSRDAPPLAANDNEPARILPCPPAMVAAPLSPEAAGGLLADIAAWITSTAIVQIPEMAMVSAIALIAGMFGDRCLGPTQSGINIFATTLLDTAGGKAHPPKSIRALADASGRPGAVTNGDHTSYAALERTLRRNPSTVVVMDEFGVTLQDVNARHRSAPAASIRKFLLVIYDQANSVFDGRIYASDDTKKDDSAIVGPALTVVGVTTPETLFAGLSEASVTDGFMNRFVFVTGTAPTKIQPPKLHRDNKPPTALVEALKTAVTACPRGAGNIGGAIGKGVVPFEGDDTGAAYARWCEVFMWQHHGAWSATERSLNGRAAENTIRLATVRALSRNPAAPAVSVEDIEWGWAIVHESIALVTDGARRHMSASPAEALRKAILEALRNAEEMTLPISQLMRRHGVRGAEMYELEGALTWLIETGEITDTAPNKRPGRGSKFRLNPVATP